MASKGFPNPIDVHVGWRIRQRRMLVGMTQERLAALIGLTFQQVQKYERGANRLGSSRLFDVAKVLDVPVSYFFEDMAESVRENTPSKLMGLSSPPTPDPFDPDPMLKRETLELVRIYYLIEKKSVRKMVMEMMKLLGKTEKRGK